MSEKLGIDQIALLERIVRPRGDWFGVQKICGLLIELLEDLEDHSEGQFPRAALEPAVIALKNTESIDGFLELSEKPRGISKLRTKHPQHAGLYEVAEKGDPSLIRRQLIVLVIVCTDQWATRIEHLAEDRQKHGVRTRGLNERIYGAWLAIRKLTDKALTLLEGSFADLQTLEDRLAELVRDSDPRAFDSKTRNYFAGLERYFAYFRGRRQRREISERNSKNNAAPILHPAKDVQERDPETEIDSPNIKRIRNVRSLKEQRASDHYQAGNCIDELGDGPTFWQSEASFRPHLGDSPQSAIIRSRGQQIHRRRLAQMLPGRWEELTDNELFLWLDESRHQLENNQSLAFVMLLLVLSGRPLDSVLLARLVRHSEQLREKPEPNAIYIDASQRAMVCGVLRPAERRQRKASWQGALRDHDLTLSLPIPAAFWIWLEAFITPLLTRCRKQSVAIFSISDGERLRDEMAGRVSEMRKGQRSRITLHRIEHHLLAALIRKGGDRVEASLISAREMPAGSSAAVYYHSCDRVKLAGLYEDTVSQWASWFPGELSPLLPTQQTLLDGTVGSNLVLVSRSLRKLVSDFKRQLDADRESLDSEGGLVRFHNSFLNYSLLLLFFGSGYRAVRDPISRESDIDFHQGLLVVADKTSDGMGHSRIVPLANVLGAQLAFLCDHLKWLREHLKWNGLLEEESTPFLFYLSPELAPIPVAPKTMVYEFNWAYPLPLNLSRHWLRTELRARGVTGSFVDYFMGHWEAGREPWAKHSCVDPVEFAESIRPELDELLLEHGFSAIRGAL